MATNKRKVLLPHTMGQQGVTLIRDRQDIETVIYPAGISQADLLPLLADTAGIALSGTPFRQTEMDARRRWRSSPASVSAMTRSRFRR